MNVWTESGGTQKARITGKGGVSGDPGPPRAPDAWHPAPAQTPGQGIRVRARARPGRIRRDQTSPAGPAGRILRGTRNAFSYLSLCLELLPGMRPPPPPPGAPECARAWVRACVCEILAVRLTYCSRRHRPLPPIERPPSPLPALPAPPSRLPPPLLQPPRLPASPPPRRAVLTSA